MRPQLTARGKTADRTEEACTRLDSLEDNRLEADRTLYVSPIDMRTNNGMAQGQHQLLSTLCSLGKPVDLLSLGASPATARQWLRERGLAATVLTGTLPLLARLNTTLWYGMGVILCNELHWQRYFRFPLRMPIPRRWIDHYDRIVCYYVWPWHLLGLCRAGGKVIVDTGDVMGDRHERIGARRWITVSPRHEEAVLQSQARCLAVSDDDVDEFQRLYKVTIPRIFFVPPDHERLQALQTVELPRRVGFMGAPGYVNEEILRLFAEPEFLGPLRQADVELVIAGGICETASRAVLARLRAGGARILGRVGSVSEYYRLIGATVNPVGPSTGVKIKSVEALMTGRKLITTRWGADASLAAAFGGQVRFADWPIDPTGLAGICIEAVQQPLAAGLNPAETYSHSAMETLSEMLGC